MEQSLEEQSPVPRGETARVSRELSERSERTRTPGGAHAVRGSLAVVNTKIQPPTGRRKAKYARYEPEAGTQV